MIQMLTCPNCLADIQSQSFKEHQSQCNQNSSQKYIPRNYDKSRLLKVYLNVQFMKPYFSINKFVERVYQNIEKIVLQLQIEPFKLILNTQEAYFYIPLQSNFSSDRIKSFIQQQINSYEVLNFTIEESCCKVLFHLQDQFIFLQRDSQVFFLEKKTQILWRVVKFMTALLSLEKVAQKFRLASQILQIQHDKEKQIEQMSSFVYEFIAKPQHLNIKTKKSQKKCFVFISGLEQAVNNCKQYLQQSLISRQNQMQSIRYRVTEQEYKVIRREKILQKYKQQIGMKFEVKNFVISRTLRVNKNCCIHLLCSSNLFTIPRSSVIILPQSLMKQVKELQQSVNCLKQYIFFSPEEDKQVLDAAEEFISYYIQKEGQIGVILPSTERTKFIQKLFSILKKVPKSITVYLLQRSDEKLAIQALNGSFAFKKEWFTFLKQKKVYYPKKVCQKIEQAEFNNLNSIQITQEDLDLQIQTHLYYPDEGVIIDRKSQVQINVEDQGEYLVAFLQTGFYPIKKRNSQNLVTFVVFQIDLANKIQINIISNKKKKISYDEKKLDKNLIQGQKTQVQLILRYPDRQTIEQIWRQIKVKLIKNIIIKLISTQGIPKDKMPHIQNWCKLNKLQITIKGKQLQAKSYNQNIISDLEKLIDLHKQKLMSGPIQYPPYWVQDQEQELKLYSIRQASQQFNVVQNNFKISKIKKLERIQNKLLFSKYCLQKQLLGEQNGQKIRQVMMYHGTRANQPSKIYADREQSFNINYANMGSYGKGIYFAKNSQYSNNYCYNSRAGKQMFYCLVLAGHSQVYNGKQQLDTSYRDEKKKIRYQSVTDNKKNESIIVVFKNRRAYPLYLITY